MKNTVYDFVVSVTLNHTEGFDHRAVARQIERELWKVMDKLPADVKDARVANHAVCEPDHVFTEEE